ncbi:BNR/Asp-box repeat protein [Francisella tularensis subsp. novicida GA99-3548]|uniref:sialidase family protein n=1 Tax=Francisella tularensis TaxID=263 RepID=UPI000158B3E8|nr:sialidase family protein [Francisella tularensis]AJI73830.1 BNR repeat-like domain protein [Francisella tularensis subsp. novicida D9876]APA82543.1 BNR/Asp-box repeat protein [Francisella tularensis subsp. novicida PA10-7858]EDN37296.1 BNR/Asp-box repeat protein [Francisella tularensis subsp. novicida GA99-3548]
MKHKLKLVLLFAFIYLILLLVFYYSRIQHNYSFAISTPRNDSITKNLDIKTIANLKYFKYNHASSMTTIDNKLFITWYSSDQETAPNTKIVVAVAEKVAGKWHFNEIKPVMNRQEFQSIFKKHIHHLGNPIIYSQAKRLWLVFTSSSGGWVTSSLNIMYSDDLGKTWSQPKTILSSNILNFSTLTRGAAIELDNNRFAIPVYKEFNNLNGRWFVFNKDGELIFVSEMTNDGVNLQPTVVPLSKTHALALYRQMHSPIKRIYTNETSDSGLSWSKVKPTQLDNPDSGIAAIKIQNGILLAYNNATDSRADLSLALKADNSQQWRNIYTFPNKIKGELSYPAFTLYQDNIILAFSDKTKGTIRIVEIKGENSNV